MTSSSRKNNADNILTDVTKSINDLLKKENTDSLAFKRNMKFTISLSSNYKIWMKQSITRDAFRKLTGILLFMQPNKINFALLATPI